MGLLDVEELERWRDQASATRDAAEATRAAGSWAWCSFLAEQGAQHAVKGLLHPVLERRRRERDGLLALARRYGEALARRLELRAAVVFGSVARGDFNAWSDVDVLVIADDLPAGGRTRLELLHDPAFPGIEPVGWTPDELAARLQQGDPIATEAAAVGVVVVGRLP